MDLKGNMTFVLSLCITVIIIIICGAILLKKEDTKLENFSTQIFQLKEYLKPVLEYYDLMQIPISLGSYPQTVDKKEIFMCHKENAPISDLAFVLLHEYAHILNKANYGHETEFQKKMLELLNKCSELGIKIGWKYNEEFHC